MLDRSLYPALYLFLRLFLGCHTFLQNENDPSFTLRPLLIFLADAAVRKGTCSAFPLHFTVFIRRWQYISEA
jgi:hypothetical protein